MRRARFVRLHLIVALLTLMVLIAINGLFSARYPWWLWVLTVWADQIINPPLQHSAGNLAEGPTDDLVSQAMDRLQDQLGKPHVKSGVWYDPKTDTYNWWGPKFGQHMSAPATQLLHDLALYL